MLGCLSEAARSRSKWSVLYHAGVEIEVQNVQRPPVARHVLCDRTVSHESHKKRHKCVEERRKSVSEQQGAVQCPQCLK